MELYDIFHENVDLSSMSIKVRCLYAALMSSDFYFETEVPMLFGGAVRDLLLIADRWVPSSRSAAKDAVAFKHIVAELQTNMVSDLDFLLTNDMSSHTLIAKLIDHVLCSDEEVEIKEHVPGIAFVAANSGYDHDPNTTSKSVVLSYENKSADSIKLDFNIISPPKRMAYHKRMSISEYYMSYRERSTAVDQVVCFSSTFLYSHNYICVYLNMFFV